MCEAREAREASATPEAEITRWFEQELEDWSLSIRQTIIDVLVDSAVEGYDANAAGNHMGVESNVDNAVGDYVANAIATHLGVESNAGESASSQTLASSCPRMEQESWQRILRCELSSVIHQALVQAFYGALSDNNSWKARTLREHCAGIKSSHETAAEELRSMVKNRAAVATCHGAVRKVLRGGAKRACQIREGARPVAHSAANTPAEAKRALRLPKHLFLEELHTEMDRFEQEVASARSSISSMRQSMPFPEHPGGMRTASQSSTSPSPGRNAGTSQCTSLCRNSRDLRKSGALPSPGRNAGTSQCSSPEEWLGPLDEVPQSSLMSSLLSASVASLPKALHGLVSSSSSPRRHASDASYCNVVLNCANIGCEYAQAQAICRGRKEGPAFDWEGVRRAICYYERRGVVTHCVALRRTIHKSPVPDDIKKRIIQCPVVDREKDVDDLVTIRLAMHYGCQFVDNDNYRDWKQTAKSESTVRQWLNDAECRQLKVAYVFDADGEFMPLRDPLITLDKHALTK